MADEDNNLPVIVIKDKQYLLDYSDITGIEWREIKQNPPGVSDKLRLAMLINGVDITGWPGGTISAAHNEANLDQTVEAFRESLRMLRAEEVI